MFGDEEFGTFWKEKSRLDEQMREIKKVHLSPITQPAKIIILLLSCKKKKRKTPTSKVSKSAFVVLGQIQESAF